MFIQALVTYFHFMGIFTMITVLVLEAVLFKPEPSRSIVKIIMKADIMYGIAAVVIALTGALKLFYFGKGFNYYAHNHIFWTKIMLFTFIGLLSIYPTIVFLSWRKEIKQDRLPELSLKQFSIISRIIIAEIVLFLFIPFCATLMARGFGYVA